MPDVLISSKLGSDWQPILEQPKLIECLGVQVLSLAHRSELRGCDVYPHIEEKMYLEIFLQIYPGYVPLNGPWIFSEFFSFFKESLGQSICGECQVFQLPSLVAQIHNLVCDPRLNLFPLPPKDFFSC